MVNSRLNKRLKMKNVFSCVKNETLIWICNAKMMIMFIFIVFTYNLITQPLCQAATEMNTKINVFEPLIALGTSGTVLLLTPLLFLFLISDFPRDYTVSCLHIVRMSRKKWLLIQLTTLGVEIIVFLFCVVVINTILVSGKADYSFVWSDVATSYADAFPEKANGFINHLLPENLYLHMDLISAFFHTYGLLFLYLYLLGLILIIACLLDVKYLGIFLDALIVVLGTALCALKIKTMWFLPMAHTVIWLHYTEYFREPIVSPIVSYLYFAVLIFLLVVGAKTIVKRYRY